MRNYYSSLENGSELYFEAANMAEAAKKAALCALALDTVVSYTNLA